MSIGWTEYVRALSGLGVQFVSSFGFMWAVPEDELRESKYEKPLIDGLVSRGGAVDASDPKGT
jgi:hypothetical protein